MNHNMKSVKNCFPEIQRRSQFNSVSEKNRFSQEGMSFISSRQQSRFHSRGQLLAGMVLVLMVVFIAANGWAQNDFLPANGNWNNSVNWSSGSVPGSAEDARIGNGSVVTVDQSEPTVGHISVGWSGAGTLSLSTGAALTVIGTGGNDGIVNNGAINQSGGSIILNNVALFLGYDTGNTASYDISGGSLTLNAGNLWARFGNVTFTQSGGAVSISDSVTWGEGGSGTISIYNLTEGSLNVGGGFYVGRATYGEGLDGSSGELNISGGVATLGSLYFGANLDGNENASVNLSGNGLLYVLQSNYSLDAANADISAGNITGTELQVSTAKIGGIDYTEVRPIPEPSSICFFVLAAGGLLLGRTGKQPLKSRRLAGRFF